MVVGVCMGGLDRKQAIEREWWWAAGRSRDAAVWRSVIPQVVDIMSYVVL